MAVEESTIARPYAEAAFKRAGETDKMDLWSEMLGFLSAVVQDAEMTALIVNPKFDKDALKELLLNVCGGRIEGEGANLIKLLIDNGRLGSAPLISTMYEQLKSEAEGIVDVTVTSAYVLHAAETNAIAQALTDRLGKEVNLSTEKDASLIGGIRIRAGDLVIDGSIQGRLRQLASEFGI